MFYNTPPWEITKICSCPIKNSIQKPNRKKRFLEKRVHHIRNCIAHVVSLKTLCEKPSSKNSHRKKKSITFNLRGHIFFRIFYSSWINIYLRDLCINFNVLANMIYMIFVILVVYLQGRFNKNMLHLIMLKFKLYCSNHTIQKYVLN